MIWMKAILQKNDPVLFLQRYKPPVIIDAIQYAQELFFAIKIIVERAKKHGLFGLSGSYFSEFYCLLAGPVLSKNNYKSLTINFL
jgi:hypothetical protein